MSDEAKDVAADKGAPPTALALVEPGLGVLEKVGSLFCLE
jgi:hypothetical protein